MKIEEIPAKQLIQKVKYDNNFWFGVDYNVNLYRGCNHGCIYCDSRSDVYGIEDFDRSQTRSSPCIVHTYSTNLSCILYTVT